jgi:hypothetical protein
MTTADPLNDRVERTIAAGVVIVGILQMLREGDTPDATSIDDPRR